MDRDALLPRSQFTGRALTNTMNRHVVLNGHRQVYCCCSPSIRGVTGYSKLRRNRKSDERWAENFRYPFLRRTSTGSVKK